MAARIATASLRSVPRAIVLSRSTPTAARIHSTAAKMDVNLPKSKKLFTPGPLGVSLSTKQAMLRDLGSRDKEFINTVKTIRSRLLELAKLPAGKYTTVPVQGSGTFAVEAVVTTFVPRTGGHMLVLSNGAYAQRIKQIADVLGIKTEFLEFPEDKKTDLAAVEEALKKHPITNVAIVHCETSSGVINPIEEVGKLVRKYRPDAFYFVDAMSSFGGVELDAKAANIDFLVSSANKCIEGVPGFSYALCDVEKLNKCKGNSRSLSLDLYEQNAGLDKSGQFRFTPATHSMLAFHKALQELDAEGGIPARAARYSENRRIIREGMRELGFKELLDDTHKGYIITSFHYHKDSKFNFEDFYSRLNAKDLVIYPGKTTKADCFRIGSIGHLFPADMKTLLVAIKEVLGEMGVQTPVKN
eukprot:Opistho-2@54455